MKPFIQPVIVIRFSLIHCLTNAQICKIIILHCDLNELNHGQINSLNPKFVFNELMCCVLIADNGQTDNKSYVFNRWIPHRVRPSLHFRRKSPCVLQHCHCKGKHVKTQRSDFISTCFYR